MVHSPQSAVNCPSDCLILLRIVIFDAPTEICEQTKDCIGNHSVFKLCHIVQHILRILIAVVCGLCKPFYSFFYLFQFPPLRKDKVCRADSLTTYSYQRTFQSNLQLFEYYTFLFADTACQVRTACIRYLRQRADIFQLCPNPAIRFRP